MSGEGTYKCNLEKDTLMKAKDELNEDPKQRTSQIETLRQWCKKQPHLNSRTDDAFLLRFLRNTKFSQLKAQDKIDNFWTIRSVEGKGAPDWFQTMDPLDPKLSELMDKGVNMALPGRDDQNRKVVIIQTGGYDPKEYSFSEMMKVGFMGTDVLLLDEMTQIHGVVIILDFSEFGTQHVLCWDRETISKASKCWQDVYPTRIKGINYYKTPTLFNALFEIFKLFMKEKTVNRLHFHKDDLESLHKQVPKRMLPTEYGGEAGSFLDLAKKWKEDIIKNRDEILRNNAYGVDESKRLKSEEKKGGWGITGTFRKIALD